MTRKSYPGGAAPVLGGIVLIVGAVYTDAQKFTKTPSPFGTWSREGLGSSATWTLLGVPGNTPMTFIFGLPLMNSVCGCSAEHRFSLLPWP